MKKIYFIPAFLVFVSFSAYANLTVYFTNSTGKKGSLNAAVGECSNGVLNLWSSPLMGNGTATGALPCPVQKTNWNYDDYIFLIDDGKNSQCSVWSENGVANVLSNGYTKVYVTVSPGAPCFVTRTYEK